MCTWKCVTMNLKFAPNFTKLYTANVHMHNSLEHTRIFKRIFNVRTFSNKFANASDSMPAAHSSTKACDMQGFHAHEHTHTRTQLSESKCLRRLVCVFYCVVVETPCNRSNRTTPHRTRYANIQSETACSLVVKVRACAAIDRFLIPKMHSCAN